MTTEEEACLELAEHLRRVIKHTGARAGGRGSAGGGEVNSFTPRFANGIYRDCKWCGGRGCLCCEAEADKEYARQFPNGPQPIITINNDEFDKFEISEATGGPTIEDAHGKLGRIVAHIFEAAAADKPRRES